MGRRWGWWVRSWGLLAAEQDEVWVRWRRGESLGLIARRLGNGARRCGPCAPQRRGATAPPVAGRAVSHHGRTRSDQPRRGRRGVVPAARGPAGTGPLDGVAGADPKRWPRLLWGPGRRRRRLRWRPAAQAGQAGDPAAAAGGGGWWWRPSWPWAGRRSRSPGGCPGLSSGAGDVGVA